MRSHWKNQTFAIENQKINMEIGARIKEARLAAGLMGKELNSRLGYQNVTSLSKIENGNIKVPAYSVVRVASILDLDVRSLLGEGMFEMDRPTSPENRKKRATANRVIGNRLREIRLGRRLPLAYTAKALGYQPSTYERIENGETEINPWAIVVACRVLNTTATAILGV